MCCSMVDNVPNSVTSLEAETNALLDDMGSIKQCVDAIV